MPIPFLFIGIEAGAAALGVGKTVKAGIDQKDANETNSQAQSIADRATQAANRSREASGKAVTDLGRQKIFVLDHSMKPFIASFEKLHNVELSNTVGMDELKKFRIDKQSLQELKEMSSMATSLLGGAASGAALGAITAFGAYGGVMAFGAASTGTAIATLSGAAATNATLAFLGGGSLAVGGLGMAGGTAVLGGLVAGPALAVMGFVLGAKASANRDAAYSNLAKARAYEEEMKTVRTLCSGIRMRATMFERLLLKLNAIFEPLVIGLEQIITENGTDFSHYTPQQKATVAAGLSIAGAIKAVLDTPILSEDGNLTEESGQIFANTQKVIDQYA